MREIKYQVYVPNNIVEGKPAATIYPVCRIDFDSQDNTPTRVYFWPDNAPRSLPIEYCKLREYTGLKDRNGVEIYEGDVIDLIVTGYVKDPAVVVWNEAEACWMYCRIFNQMGIYVKWTPVEVIGNIYLNPELVPVQEVK